MEADTAKASLALPISAAPIAGEGRPGGASWSVAEVPYHLVDASAIHDDVQWLEILASASLVEITSDLYTRNLIEFFEADTDVVAWLTERWEREEVQHGLALKRYVETVWPEFDWDGTYRSFFAEYSRLCAVELLAPGHALEMVARCVVETGTASLYRMLAEAAPEPVLRALARAISDDEVRHYKYFYRFFLRWRTREKPGRMDVLRTLMRRSLEAGNQDALIAFKHVHLTLHPGTEFRRADYLDFRARVRRMAKRHLPREMAVKMLLKPLDLAPALARAIPHATSAAFRFLFFG